jgi:hypothetical protein
MTINVYPNDDPDTAAKKIAKDLKEECWRVIPKAKIKDDNNEPKPKRYTVYKYSKDIPLAEEITLGNKNVFLQIIDDQPITLPEIDLRDQNIIIKPHDRNENTPIIPFTFRNLEEIKYFIDQAEKETIHSLYIKSKSLWKCFVVAKDDDTITLLAVDQVYSYFQDLFPTTHYDMVTGSPGSGKNAILVTMKQLGYRVILASDTSGANLLDMFGSVESGQVVLAEDEFDDIDKDEIKKKLIKVGYDEEGIVPRTLDGNTSNRHNEWYYVFSYKIIAAENRLDSKNLSGLNDRIFQIESIKGSPKFLIKTIRKEMKKPVEKQKPEYREVISKINYLRKLLLIYRILHHKDIIEEVPLNIDGRAFELTSPQIFLFGSNALSSGEYKPALKEVLKMLSRFLQKKGELTKKTLEGVVHETLEKELFPTMTSRTLIDVNGRSILTYTIPHRDIIDKVIQLTDGVSTNNPNEKAFYSTEYSKITHKRILKICRERFSGEPDTIGRGEEKERALTFDKEIVEKVGRTFEIISEIKILEPASNHKEEEEGRNDMEDWGIPIPSPSPSQDRPQKEEHNHAQIEEVGTEGQKFGNSERIKEDSDKELCLKYLVEREKKVKYDVNDSNTLFSENRPISVLSSPSGEIPERCYYCDYKPTNELEYRRHGNQKHFNKPLYPNKATLEKYNLKLQGMEWEV